MCYANRLIDVTARAHVTYNARSISGPRGQEARGFKANSFMSSGENRPIQRIRLLPLFVATRTVVYGNIGGTDQYSPFRCASVYRKVTVSARIPPRNPGSPGRPARPLGALGGRDATDAGRSARKVAHRPRGDAVVTSA